VAALVASVRDPNVVPLGSAVMAAELLPIAKLNRILSEIAREMSTAGAGYDAPPGLEQRTEVDVTGWEELCADLPLSHMGRGRGDDRLFFATAFAAGRAASRKR